MTLAEFLQQLRQAAAKSGVIVREEMLQLGSVRAKLRFHLSDGSYADIFVNVATDKYYYHWQKQRDKIYRINNFPAHGWHEHIDTEEHRQPAQAITPEQFFSRIKAELQGPVRNRAIWMYTGGTMLR